MNWKWKIATFVAALSSLTLVGTNAAVAAPTDACSLLTPDQVTSVLGISAKPGHPVPSDTTDCDWPLASLAKMTAKDAKEVEVKILDAESWAVIAPAAKAAPPLKGVGDYADYLGDAYLMSLYVQKGNVKLEVNVHGFPLDQIKAKEKTLAQNILAKM